MCGIVTFWGRYEGLSHVLEALHLLQYRAPDSSGVAAIRADGSFAVRRSVGGPGRLIQRLANRPLFAPIAVTEDGLRAMLARQGLELSPGTLRDCSSESIARLYETPPLCVGIGDRGAGTMARWSGGELSGRMRRALREAGNPPTPDCLQDPVTHAFRLLGAHVASRVALNNSLRQSLDSALQARIPGKAYESWQEAWLDELSCNVPGQAFAVAARHFQETFPGLAEHLQPEEWERVGGLTARAMAQTIMGHGRWAMVGAVSVDNAHPFLDRSQTRAVCENGSHNARLMLGLQAEQKTWWRQRGVPQDEAAHRSDNTTEVIAYEWERIRHTLEEGSAPSGSQAFLEAMDEWDIEDVEERALRLTLWRTREGNAHACAFYSRHRPHALYVNSHHKPVAIIMRTVTPPGAPPRRDVMVASDVNAGLMLWPGAEVEAAAAALEAKQADRDKILGQFTVDVIFLDADLFQGEELLACISNHVAEGQVQTGVEVSRYDGTPLSVKSQRMQLNPAMGGKRGYASYTESHIAEIPDVLDAIVRAYVDDGRVHLDSAWRDGSLVWPGLNVNALQARFGNELSQLQRILLLGEGSSWRDAQVAAPIFRDLFPDVTVNVFRPVEVLNLGKTLDAAHDLAVEISWSGTTDSLLKVDAWLAESDLLRVAVTGRAQSDLGRRASRSGGVLDVRSGVEVSVATVKGFEAILMTLDLLALQLAAMRPDTVNDELPGRALLLDELSRVIPQHARRLIEDQARRQRLREVAQRCRHFNKVAVIGSSPIDLEGELKIEEIAQVVGLPIDFHATSLRPLMERSALVESDAARTLFIFNVTTQAAHAEARPLIAYLQSLRVFCIVHTTPHALVSTWQEMENTAVFVTPQVAPQLQPLLDAPFFFDLAVALGYARGLSPAAIDSPRNLAKSVTTTGAERRVVVESRPELENITLEQFSRGQRAQVAWNARGEAPSRQAFRATVALRAALSVIGDPLPSQLEFERQRQLLVITDTEATENAAHMSAAAWHQLLGIDLTVYRRFISSQQEPTSGTAWLRLVRAGVVLAVPDANTIALPADMSPMQLELLGAVYLMGLAVRRAREQGQDVAAWRNGLAQLPLLVAEVLLDRKLTAAVRNALSPYIAAGFDKFQVIGGGQDFAAAASITRSLRMRGFMAEELYTDSAWHGPLATVGGDDAEHNTLIIILATDPLFQAAALVDTQVYRTRNAPVLLIVPRGNEKAPPVLGVHASTVLPLPPCPRPFLPVVNAAFGEVLARQVSSLDSAR